MIANVWSCSKLPLCSLSARLLPLGGLLSAHMLASDPDTGFAVPGYADGLLHLATDLGRRLLPAFDTPTGVPYGAVNLRHGVAETESKMTSTAGGGTMCMEFGLLSRLTGDGRFEAAALRSLRALWSRRSRLNLVGAHIDIITVRERERSGSRCAEQGRMRIMWNCVSLPHHR